MAAGAWLNYSISLHLLIGTLIGRKLDDAFVAVGDDHVAIKAGLSPLARRSFPRFSSQNVTVRYNTMRTGMGVSVGACAALS